jgi:hypothetical protein
MMRIWPLPAAFLATLLVGSWLRAKLARRRTQQKWDAWRRQYDREH